MLLITYVLVCTVMADGGSALEIATRKLLVYLIVERIERPNRISGSIGPEAVVLGGQKLIENASNIKKLCIP